ncbi:amino acid ABC transporter membrane protein 1 (PAAT family) [Dongia mobilis]|uniref:Amino acid ABC transporter membrane protein 1 (PAAT family) n=1 Tax=Dongia mobilis TaxID=578943 RepID=A0A4R6WGQ0_9PROT|nr:ABC transporter permease subunit [Dongia mobilis]TDQ77600.1 amino acid ABC transporter membrane protein 1 (PAAT family) [Dongia mobilis]
MASAKSAAAAANGENSIHQKRIAFWRDERTRGVIAQVVTILVLAGLFWFLISNFLEKQARSAGPAISFDFLNNVAGFQLSFSLLPITLDSPIGLLIVAAGISTLLVAFFAAIIATLLGLVVGVLRLSHNWLISRIAATFIEIIRNIPLLLQLVFWYTAVLTVLPRHKDSLTLFDVAFLNIKGMFLPRPFLQEGAGILLFVVVVAIGAAVMVARWARNRQMLTGQQFPVWSVNLLIVMGLPLLAYLALHEPIGWEIPEKGGFNFKGGLTVQPEMTALIVGLGVSTAAYVAEIVRAGIMSVSHGQTEAASALGLKANLTLRLVVLPQALRVMIPPMISQYLNVVKNSTLAGFIGFADLFSVISTSQNQTGRAIECIIILMAFYLMISLIISSIMNVYNKRVALVER